MNTSLNLDTRTLFISGEIDVDTALETMVVLHELAHADDAPVTIRLNSPGGCETSGYAIYDAIMAHPDHVTIIGTGAVMSIAAAIFQAADTRILTPTSTYMIHDGSVGTAGEMEVQALLALARETEINNEKYTRILCRASGQPYRRVRQWCKDEAFFSARQAVKLGFADRVARR